MRTSSKIKSFLAIAALLLGATGTLTAPEAHAAKGKSTCRVETTDVGTIIGKGRSAEAAFEDAATQCFDRHSRLHQSKTGRSPDESSGLDIIDTCANLRCES
jgi:hypothetical protein